MKKSEALRRFIIVCMDFGRTVRKIVMAAVQTIRIWKLYQLLLRENFLYLTAKCLVHSIIIVSVKKAAVLQVCSQSLHFKFRKSYVPVSRHEYEWIGEELIIRYFDKLVNRIDIDQRVLLNKPEQIDFLIWIVIPIAAASVLQALNLKRAVHLYNLRRHVVWKKNSKQYNREEKLFHIIKRYEIDDEEANRK